MSSAGPVYRKVMVEFINEYKRHKCLWKYNKSREQRHKRRRISAITSLKSILSKIEPDADDRAVKQKIDRLRGSFYRQKKKIDQSVQNGDSPAHEPTLWYYNNMKFMYDSSQEDLQDSEHDGSGEGSDRSEESLEETVAYYDSETGLMSEDPIGIDHEMNIEKVEPSADFNSSTDNEHSETSQLRMYLESGTRRKKNQNIQKSSPIGPPSIKRRRLRPVPTFMTACLPQYSPSHSTDSIGQEHKTDAFTKIVDLELKKLNEKQLCIAQKLMSDVLFYAKLSKLTEKAKVTP